MVNLVTRIVIMKTPGSVESGAFFGYFMVN